MSESRRITIDVDAAGAAPPVGRVVAGSQVRTFAGWLGLLSALSEVLEAPAGAPDDVGSDDDA